MRPTPLPGKKEIAVALMCSALLLMNLGAVGSRGREQGKRIACLTNLRQLTLAWNVYADDNDDRIVNGEAYSGADGLAPIPKSGTHAREHCWTGDDVAAGFMDGERLPEEIQVQAIMAGALWPYCGDVRLYRCPSGHPGEIRNYSIVDSMNGLPKDGTSGLGGGGRIGRREGATVLWIKKRTEILVPKPADRIVFVDEGRITPDSYAVHYINDRWWDPPPVRHGVGGTLSFVDGHTEHWKWQGRKTIETGTLPNPLSQMSPETPLEFEDLHRMQRGVWGRLQSDPVWQ